MISKIAPLVMMGMGAQSYYNKTKQGKKDKEIAKKAAKKRMSKSKCKSCGGKGCSKCSKGKY